MNDKQIQRFVSRYVDATGSRIVEKSPAHMTVKLSPAADRELTNRPYYWSYVDRAGVEPETMTYLFVTDSKRYDEQQLRQAEAEASAELGALDQAAHDALSRSIGFVHGAINGVRTPREDLYFGSRKLDQLFEAARVGGSYVYLFQEPERRSLNPFDSIAYTAWLGVNLRVEFACDMKREEIHSYGISLATGNIQENFHERLSSLRLTPKLPANVHTARNGFTLARALATVEAHLEKKLRGADFSWAEGAARRLEEELAILAHYYEKMLESAEDEHKDAIAAQYETKRQEIRWQYEPRVTVSAINCGVFHLEGID
ncbi:YqhG family protein [Paenibacillus pasadenensis]|uniref:YqhG family protein n=1 Tax=Paenibacillus pasadenensis TaxID=217090 RepID=UPI00203BC139|nr:YqhG family protein [Paenibacillus pasadenensis]MCM3747203.1 YqhG family protein [Paenibacillus pasadenensis]